MKEILEAVRLEQPGTIAGKLEPDSVPIIAVQLCNWLPPDFTRAQLLAALKRFSNLYKDCFRTPEERHEAILKVQRQK